MEKEWTNSESEPLAMSYWKVKYNKQHTTTESTALPGGPPRVKEYKSADTIGCFQNSALHI